MLVLTRPITEPAALWIRETETVLVLRPDIPPELLAYLSIVLGRI